MRAPTPLALATLLVLAGCGSVRTFQGDRPAGQVAVIVPENRFNRAQAAGPFGARSGATGEVRVRVGGRSLGGWNNRFEVLPGRHELAVVYTDEAPQLPEQVLRTRQVTLPLDARAGHVYAIRGRATFGGAQPSVRIWAVDAADRRTVASVQVPRQNILLVDDPQSAAGDD